MNLHANAALSWTGRRRLCELVVDQGWTIAAAASSAGVSVRCARKWIGRYRLEGEAGLRDRSSRPRRVANCTPPERVEAIAKLRRLRFTAAEIAETLAMALSTVSGILTRSGMGRLGRLGLEPAVRYERSRPGELVHVDVKKLGRIVGGAGWRVRGGAKHYNATYTDRAGRRRRTVGYEFVHVAIDGLQPARLRRSTPRRKGVFSDRLPSSRRCLLPPPRHRSRTDPDRQRLRLPRRHARRRLSPARDPTHPHPALPAANKRESRTLHPHHAQRLGLRRDLPLEPRANKKT